jgi:hypothetical protein
VVQSSVFVLSVYATQHNFGYEDIGSGKHGSKFAIIRGSVFTCPDSGTADNITVCFSTASATISLNVKCAIYLHSDLSCKGVTEERTITVTSTATWFTFNFVSSPPSLTAAIAYVLVAFTNVSTVYNYMSYITGDTNQGHIQTLAYNGFPDPLVPSHLDFKYSIYCTYTVAGGGPLSFFGSSSLSFAANNAKTMSLNLYGGATLTFVAESLRSLARTLILGGSAQLGFLSEQLRTFTFNRYGTAPLSFTVESLTEGLGRILTFFGLAVLNFTVFGEASGLAVMDLISLALCVLALAFAVYPLVTGEEKALPFTALVVAVFGLALAVLGLWYALPIAALSFILSIAALATRKD